MAANRKCDVLADGQRVEECRVLKQESHPLPHARQSAAVESGHVLVVDEHPTRIRPEQSDDLL